MLYFVVLRILLFGALQVSFCFNLPFQAYCNCCSVPPPIGTKVERCRPTKPKGGEEAEARRVLLMPAASLSTLKTTKYLHPQSNLRSPSRSVPLAFPRHGTSQTGRVAWSVGDLSCFIHQVRLFTLLVLFFSLFSLLSVILSRVQRTILFHIKSKAHRRLKLRIVQANTLPLPCYAVQESFIGIELAIPACPNLLLFSHG